MRHKPNQTVNYVRNLKPGSHGVFFYRSPEEKHEVLFNFLQAGLERDEGAIYVASQETPKQIRGHMEDFGLNVTALETEMRVLRILDYDGLYIIDGTVNASRIVELGKRLFDQAVKVGVNGLRVCGEAACFFEHKKEKELVEYELMLGRNFDLPITALCAYDVKHAKSLQEKFFLDLIRAHGLIVTSNVAEEVKFESFFPTVVDEVLETSFGQIGKETILAMLKRQQSLSRGLMAEDPECFMKALESLVGSGTHVIMKSLVDRMHLKMGITRGPTSI